MTSRNALGSKRDFIEVGRHGELSTAIQLAPRPRTALASREPDEYGSTIAIHLLDKMS